MCLATPALVQWELLMWAGAVLKVQLGGFVVHEQREAWVLPAQESWSLAVRTALPSPSLGMIRQEVGGKFSSSGNWDVQILLPVLLKGHCLVKILGYTPPLFPPVPGLQWALQQGVWVCFLANGRCLLFELFYLNWGFRACLFVQPVNILGQSSLDEHHVSSCMILLRQFQSHAPFYSYWSVTASPNAYRKTDLSPYAAVPVYLEEKT